MTLFLAEACFFYSDGIKNAAFALAEVRRTRNAIKINCDGFVGLLLIKVGSCRDKNFGLKYLRLVEFAVVNPRFFNNYVFAKHVNVQDVQEKKYKIKTASVG
jgi:hypothetical protein